MTRKILNRSFFKRDTHLVARELLGKYMKIEIGRKKLSLMINEVEIYDGFNDKASHAYKGDTKRNKPMFKGGGIWYVYLVYGMHYMINVVTREKGYPGAVLIRGAGKYNGPGKLSKALSISSDLNNKSISRKTGIWVEDWGEVVIENDIIQTSRIGVAYAGKYWSKKKLRLILKNRPPKTGKAILNQKN